MKTFALAATVVAGLLFTAGSADAQYRYRTGGFNNASGVRVYPNFNSSPYNYGYNGVVGVGNFAPLGGTAYVAPAGGFYAPSFYAPSYNYSSYSNYSNFGVSPYYGGYSGYSSYSSYGSYGNYGGYRRGFRW